MINGIVLAVIQQARSSGGEHYPDTVGVMGSNPIVPTRKAISTQEPTAHGRLFLSGISRLLKPLKKGHSPDVFPVLERLVDREGAGDILNRKPGRIEDRDFPV